MSKKPTPLAAIREQCLTCMGAHDGFTDVFGKWCPPHRPVKLVRECPDANCGLYAFRFGTDPYRRRSVSENSLKALDSAREKRVRTCSKPQTGAAGPLASEEAE